MYQNCRVQEKQNLTQVALNSEGYLLVIELSNLKIRCDKCETFSSGSILAPRTHFLYVSQLCSLQCPLPPEDGSHRDSQRTKNHFSKKCSAKNLFLCHQLRLSHVLIPKQITVAKEMACTNWLKGQQPTSRDNPA